MRVLSLLYREGKAFEIEPSQVPRVGLLKLNYFLYNS